MVKDIDIEKGTSYFYFFTFDNSQNTDIVDTIELIRQTFTEAMFCMLEITENMEISIPNFMVLLWANEQFQSKDTCFFALQPCKARLCTLEIAKNMKMAISSLMVFILGQ